MSTADSTLQDLVDQQRRADSEWQRHRPFHICHLNRSQRQAYGLHTKYPSMEGVMLAVASYLADADEASLERMQTEAKEGANEYKPDPELLLITAALQAVRDLGYDLPEPGDEIRVRLRGGDIVEGVVTSLAKDGGQNIVLYDRPAGHFWCYPHQIVRGAK